MSASKIILVTGANRGIGFAIVQLLAKQSPESTIMLACRDETKAKQAIDQLADLGFKSNFRPLTLDVTNDESIRAAATLVDREFGKIDVLINNAASATAIEADNTNYRTAWASALNVNVISVGFVTQTFVPLLQKSSDPRVVNISSARASFALAASGKMPPTANMPYSVSKAALNMLVVDMTRTYPDVLFQAVSPGHCKTGLNGFRGAKDPLDGAKSAVEVALADRAAYKSGFWQWEANGMEEVKW